MSSRLFIYYLYLATCTTPFPYRTTFVSFNSNITGVTGGVGTGGPFRKDNQNLQIEGQTIQWPREKGQTIQWSREKEQEDKQCSTKH
jgi:hypothetical protein